MAAPHWLSMFKLSCLWQLRRKDKRIESRLVDDYDISFVVRTGALNRCSGFIFIINMICNSIFWCTIAQSLCPPLAPLEVLLSWPLRREDFENLNFCHWLKNKRVRGYPLMHLPTLDFGHWTFRHLDWLFSRLGLPNLLIPQSPNLLIYQIVT